MSLEPHPKYSEEAVGLAVECGAPEMIRVLLTGVALDYREQYGIAERVVVAKPVDM